MTEDASIRFVVNSLVGEGVRRPLAEAMVDVAVRYDITANAPLEFVLVELYDAATGGNR